MEELKKDRFYIAVDAVIFTILDKELKILLIKRKNDPFKGRYALPGGFVELDENLEDAARRELEEETGVKNIFLKKLHAFGDVGRDPRGRVITIPFLALIDGDKIKFHSTSDAELARWHSVYDLPDLAFDHKKIIEDALQHLRFEMQNTNIAFQMMPEKFTLTELQQAHEIVLDKKTDKRNFRKKISELGILKGLPETKMEGAHRPAKIYSFKLKGYRML
ncbi:NUDIX hydrolase [Candidatus Woesearchaeota archaeon]|nr:NUDIX hydrolase [Candidatus Woesearchaeota archaeon]